MAAPPIFPEFDGRLIEITRRPLWSTGSDAHVSGRLARVGYFSQANPGPAPGPIYEWDLRYDVLRDFAWGAIDSDLKRLEGFFLDRRARLEGFLFRDPDDDAVVGQYLGTGDGGTKRFRVVRTFGDIGYGVPGDAAITEPIGWVNTAEPVNIYINGLLQPTGAYSIVQEEAVPIFSGGGIFIPSLANYLDLSLPYASPGNQFVEFVAAPGAGLDITADFGFYFYVRFGDDSYPFENFARQLWELKKVTLVSLRRQPALAAPFGPPPPPPPPPPGVLSLDGDGVSFFTPVDHTTPDVDITVTTAFPDDVIVVHVVINAVTQAVPINVPPEVVGISDNSGLTWHRRAKVNGITATDGYAHGPTFNDSEVWWAAAPTAGTRTITIHHNSDLGFFIVDAFAVNGSPDIYAPWSLNGSLPAIGNHLFGNAGATQVPQVAPVSTDNTGDMVLFFEDEFSLVALLAGPTGFATIAGNEAVQAFIGLIIEDQISYEIAPAPLSSATLAATLPVAALPSWYVIADALRSV